MSSVLVVKGFFNNSVSGNGKGIEALAKNANDLALKVLGELQKMSGNPIEVYSEVDPKVLSVISDAVIDQGGYDISPKQLALSLAAALKQPESSLVDNARNGLEALPAVIAGLVAEQAARPAPTA